MTSPEERTEPDPELEDIVAEFILRQEDGEGPTVEEYITRYPRYATDLAMVLADPSGPPRWDANGTSRTDADDTFTVDVSSPSHPDELGPYEILERIGAGGGGTVFRARHKVEDHVVALKVLDRFASGDPRDLERFEREARMLRGMDLVNVVPVFAVGSDDGRHWIAMKWIDGSTLSGLSEEIGNRSDDERAARLRPMEERARLIARIARTFEAVHGYGILHRDIKPMNILVDRLGEPAIIDFGIAQAPELGELTRSVDGLLGTPRYLAPELLEGGNAEVTRQTDIYGLGLCLYELATGTRAFIQETRTDLFTQIRTTGPLEPRRVAKEVPRELSAIIMRATHIKPHRRYESMGAFADDLERFARGEAPDAVTMRRAAPWRRFLARRWKGVAAAGLVVLAAIASGLWFKERSDSIARLENLSARVEPWFLALPEVAARDDPGLLQAASELAAHHRVTPDQRLRAAWIACVSGRWETASSILGPGSSSEPPGNRLLRDWLNARTSWDQRGSGTTLFPAIPEGFPTTDVRKPDFPREEWSGEAEQVRLRMRMPPPDVVETVLAQGTPAESDATWLNLRAILAVIALPNGFIDREEGTRIFTRTREYLTAAIAKDDGNRWVRYAYATMLVRFGDPREARPLLERLSEELPTHPEVPYLIALSHCRPGVRDADAGAASRAFEKAAALVHHRRERRGRVAGDTALEDQFERKVYAAWALHELARDRPEDARRAVSAWKSRRQSGAIPGWRDGDHWHDELIPALLSAWVMAATEGAEEAREMFRAARDIVPDLALPLLEEARFEREVEDDRRAERTLLKAAMDVAVYKRQAPRSLWHWVNSGWFGLRPYGQELLGSTRVFAPRNR